MRITYGYNVWLEVTMLPFLGVLALFQYLRYATVAEINKRSRLLTVSTFLATFLEIVSVMSVDFFGHRQIMNLIIRTFYYAVENVNAYYLMRYVEAYVRLRNRKLERFNFMLLISSFAILLLNLMPGISGFFFSISSEGGLQAGEYNVLFRSLYVFYFITMAAYHQITNRQYYTEKLQFAVMSTLGAILILAFIIQYSFVRDTLFSYAVCTVVLFVTFFYYEAPMYRQMATVEKELEESRERTEKSTQMANAANRAKSDFLANTSHEIRTPMNAILGMNEMILKECHDPEIRQASLDIRRAGTHLLSIINNILDISKIESGKMELYNADYHIWQMIKDIEESMFESVNDKGLKLVLDIDKSLPEHLYGDEDHLRQVIINLLDNALKYTSEGTVTLKVAGDREKGRVKMIISVIDTGIGIRKDDLKHLFHSFERVNLTETQNIQGAGLGLTLVRYLLDLMGGKIHAESEYGHGSSFIVELTQQLSHDGFQGTIAEYEKVLAERPVVKTEEDTRPFICPKARLLIVDDTPVNLVVAKGMLNETKAQVETAESGEDCLKMIEKTHYDIIFLDHRMPGLDGIETLVRAKQIQGASIGAAYIALTANSGSGLREEYIGYGFDDYLAKPLKSDALKKILSKSLPNGLKER